MSANDPKRTIAVTERSGTADLDSARNLKVDRAF